MRFFSILGLLMATIVFAGESTKVEGGFEIPANVATFSGQLVDIRLYEYDPFLADVGATLIDQVKLKDFGHSKGTATQKSFTLGAKGTTKDRMQYYVTLFVLKDGKRTHMGKVPDKFMAHVLGTHPRTLTMIVNPVGR